MGAQFGRRSLKKKTAVTTVTTSAAAENCSIRDSSLCLANPNCHWEYQGRGCEPGPAPDQDGCLAHEAKDTCNVDGSLGCKWSDDANKCQRAK